MDQHLGKGLADPVGRVIIDGLEISGDVVFNISAQVAPGEPMRATIDIAAVSIVREGDAVKIKTGFLLR